MSFSVNWYYFRLINGIFGEFLESNHLALPCTYSKCHQDQRHAYNTSLRNAGPRRLDYIAVPKTWLADTTQFVVLEHFDAYTIIYDHKPVAVEIQGSIMSREVISTIPRFDKRGINSTARLPRSHVPDNSTCGCLVFPLFCSLFLGGLNCYVPDQESCHWCQDRSQAPPFSRTDPNKTTW